MAEQSSWPDPTNWEVSEGARPILRNWCPHVSTQRLSKNDVRFVIKALKTCSGKWEDIGLAAGVEGLDEIKRKFNHNAYRQLIAMIDAWLSDNFNPEKDGSNVPSWWKIVDVVADNIGGANPRQAKIIAENWRDYGKDTFSKLAMTASNDNLLDYDVAKIEKKIYSELKGVSNTWFEIGTLLGISIRKLLTFPDQVPQDQSLCDTCLRLVIKEWLSGNYHKEHGYPNPSMMVLVDVVEHQAGGGNPALAAQLVKLQLPSRVIQKSSSGLRVPEQTTVPPAQQPSYNPATIPIGDLSGQPGQAICYGQLSTPTQVSKLSATSAATQIADHTLRPSGHPHIDCSIPASHIASSPGYSTPSGPVPAQPIFSGDVVIYSENQEVNTQGGYSNLAQPSLPHTGVVQNLGGPIQPNIGPGQHGYGVPIHQQAYVNPRDEQLNIEDHHETVTHYLRNISNPDAIKLGGALGLYHPNLKRMNDLPGDMVNAWLGRKEDVLKRTGPPTWSSLIAALRKTGHNGVAYDIEKDNIGGQHGQISPAAAYSHQPMTGYYQPQPQLPPPGPKSGAIQAHPPPFYQPKGSNPYQASQDGYVHSQSGNQQTQRPSFSSPQQTAVAALSHPVNVSYLPHTQAQVPPVIGFQQGQNVVKHCRVEADSEINQGSQSAQRSEVFPSARWKLEWLHSQNHDQLTGKAPLRGQGTVIAILDGGVDDNHPSLRSKFTQRKISGYNFVPNCTSDPSTNQPNTTVDPNQWYGPDARQQHGTAVAAIAGGHAFTSTITKPNGETCTLTVPEGIASDAHLHICRIFDTNGKMHNLHSALQYLLQLLQQNCSIDILCMSFKASADRIVEDLLEQLTKKGIVCIAAAGNEGLYQDGADFPASDPNVLSVGALKPQGRKADISPEIGIDVYAHGEDLVIPTLTTETNTAGIELCDGTSLATPMVAGFLALLIQCAKELPGSTANVVKEYHNIRFLKKLFLRHELCEGQKLIRASEFLMEILNQHSHGENYIVKLIRFHYNDFVP